MANLLNIVDAVRPAPRDLSPDQGQRYEAYQHFQTNVDWLKEQGRDAREVANRLYAENDQRLDALMWDVFWDQGTLPMTLAPKAKDVLGKLAQNPTAELSNIQRIVEKLGFVILPFEYLNPASYAQEPREMKEAIQNFGSLRPDQLDIYVAYPAVHYSYENQLKAEDPNKKIWVSTDCRQAFLAIQLTIPMARSQYMSIELIKQNQQTLQSNQRQLESNIRSLAETQRMMMATMEDLARNTQSQLQNMSEAISQGLALRTEEAVEQVRNLMRNAPMGEEARARASALINKLRTSSTMSEIQVAEQALKALTFELLEPLMFAVKKGTKIHDGKATCFLGPCWGPDFADILAVAQGLKVDHEQRKTLTEITGKLWTSRGYFNDPSIGRSKSENVVRKEHLVYFGRDAHVPWHPGMFTKN
jgi:hypothetical protein